MRAVFALLACAVATEAGLNPITRVAELLEGLAKKVHMDGEAEQELYDHYKCWCTKVIDSKTASIAKAETRIGELTTYIDDLNSGDIELTTERVDLEKEIKELETAIAEETAMRTKENEDYLAAKDEMDKAVTALTSAVQVLGEATAEDAPADLLAMSKKLKNVMSVGEGFLAKKDLSALTKALDVPEVDWKKLNTNKNSKYAARSGDIQGILSDMLNTFEDNRDDALAAEEKSKTDFDALIGGKNDLLDNAKTALLEKAQENGAKATALSESNTEKDDLTAQNERDTTFLADTHTACDAKESEWGLRKTARADEIAAINEAIGVLRSDDARDTFGKSMESQGFIQMTKHTIHKHRQQKALSMIRKLAAVSKDSRLASLSTALAAEVPEELENEGNPFAEVIGAVEGMVGTLKDEEADDLANKELCEKERMENTQEAKMISKNIDTNTETMDRHSAKIAASNKTIEEIDAEIAELGEQKQDAADQRTKENTEFLAAKGDDEKAVELVQQAVTVLKGFYESRALLQVEARRVQQEPFVAGGEAPTPPPTTFSGEYGGAQGESQGIIAIMELIKEDIEKDMTKAETNEAESVTAHGKFNDDIDASVESLEGTKSDTNDALSAAENSLGEEKTTKGTNQDELDSKLGYLKSIAPGCDFIAVNFGTRLTNRQAEVDGLNKAKAVLQGAGAV